jgi:hypothetical protein
MKTIKTLVHRRPLVVGLGLAAAALALTLLLPAESAAIPCGYQYTYYSSPSYTTIVGVYGHYPQSCGCGDFQWGTATAYKKGKYITFCDEPY